MSDRQHRVQLSADGMDFHVLNNHPHTQEFLLQLIEQTLGTDGVESLLGPNDHTQKRKTSEGYPLIAMMYSWFVQGSKSSYISLDIFTQQGRFTLDVSSCEEVSPADIVGLVQRQFQPQMIYMQSIPLKTEVPVEVLK